MLHQWEVYIKEFTSIFGPHNTVHDVDHLSQTQDVQQQQIQ